MRKIIGLSLSLLILVLTWNQATAAPVKLDNQDTNVTIGKSLTLSFQVDESEISRLVVVPNWKRSMGTPLNQQRKIVSTSPYEVTVSAPEKLLESPAVRVIGVGGDGLKVFEREYKIQLETDRPLRKLKTFPSEIEKHTGEGVQLQVTGLYAHEDADKGIGRRFLQRLPSINFYSKDTDVAVVNSQGLVRLKNPGRTDIVVSSQDVSHEVPVRVLLHDFRYPILHDDVNRVMETKFDTSIDYNQAPYYGKTFTFTQFQFAGGDTCPSPVECANPYGHNASYVVNTNAFSNTERLKIYLWTRHELSAMMMDVFTEDLFRQIESLPPQFPKNHSAGKVLKYTTLFLEFGNKEGKLLSDLQTSASIRNQYSYTLVYNLSGHTTRELEELGVDLSPGTEELTFYYADHHTGQWQELEEAEVIVENKEDNQYRTVRVSGITRDLVGGLGPKLVK